MRRPFLLLSLLALAAFACSSPGPSDPATARGATVYRAHCASCHGEERAGKRTAPALLGMAQHWTPERLAEYLQDPPGLASHDPRLLHLSGRYTLKMPPFPHLQAEEVRDLSTFLLGARDSER